VLLSCCSEPDSYGLTWLGTQLKGQGLGYWYHQIMKIGYAINPSACSSAPPIVEPDLWPVPLAKCMRAQSYLTQHLKLSAQRRCTCLRAWPKADWVPTGATATPPTPASCRWCAMPCTLCIDCCVATTPCRVMFCTLLLQASGDIKYGAHRSGIVS